ncbi:MAG: hypothetical protein HYS12_13855 [Planctomycetes bacterium]|nr:hypothetical protein [Planctomycetota bacterium]
MRRMTLLGCCLLLAAAGRSSAVAAARELAPAEKEKARAQLRRLADRNFKAREQATAELLRLGPAARSILEEGVKDSDAEVRRRCGLLLRLASRTDTEIALEDFMIKKDSTGLLKLPSWGRFSKSVGADDAAKRLFVDMYCNEGTMLAQLDRSPEDFATKFQEHVQTIQRNLYTPWGVANSISHPKVLALVFMASDSRLADNLQVFYALNSLFYQPSVQQGFKDNAGSRKLLVAFLESRTNPSTVSQAFYIARQLQLKEALPLALKTVKTKTTQSYTRGTAVLFIGQVGGKEHIKDLEPLLEDTTQMGAIRTGTATINAQLRDVALAAMIQMSGQNLFDYPFPFLQQYRNLRGNFQLPPYYYGFQDDAGRTAAMKKWRESQPKTEPTKEPKKKESAK